MSLNKFKMGSLLDKHEEVQVKETPKAEKKEVKSKKVKK